ncbi:hypothetical protein MAR_019969 [Mya arenaria]|uniref:Uncharacterized protein n=1 Tax=Mya arenaria TaxID=6604 RepID=A0ABY7E6P8_MYAAR|nr:hypothetical protein MAR_019969 [Mya arenaria]
MHVVYVIKPKHQIQSLIITGNNTSCFRLMQIFIVVVAVFGQFLFYKQGTDIQNDIKTRQFKSDSQDTDIQQQINKLIGTNKLLSQRVNQTSAEVDELKSDFHINFDNFNSTQESLNKVVGKLQGISVIAEKAQATNEQLNAKLKLLEKHHLNKSTILKKDLSDIRATVSNTTNAIALLSKHVQHIGTETNELKLLLNENEDKFKEMRELLREVDGRVQVVRSIAAKAQEMNDQSNTKLKLMEEHLFNKGESAGQKWDILFEIVYCKKKH